MLQDAHMILLSPGGWILVDISNHACFVKNGD